MRLQKCICLMGSLLLLGAAPALAATFTVDADTMTFGWMNVFDVPCEPGQEGALWGSGWGLPDLPATFDGDVLTVGPNTNAWDPADPYWVTPEGEPNKWMEANVYGEMMDDALMGETLEFAGLTVSNTLAEDYMSMAFVKVLDPAQGWATIASTFVPLVPGAQFSASLVVPDIAGLLTQYGLATCGPVTDPEVAPQMGTAVVTTPEPASLALLALVGLLARRR